ncbi:SDR family oxidoreductase [Paenibacillus sp. IB182496]|uniref:SDR family oxidoreductase n=1 Tax=Paenibacillus sabuli TaxID=2772509 RepID=A0A927BSX1_9BACL|nr:SDR family oxidoreductase [Paenibacillus sabuli]MBD2844939.1 SDR family oxidoreductase [Paenibacillus sabuli]
MRDKVVAVTGANAGMGLATVVELARQGARVVMLCRSESRGREALREAKRLSGSETIALMTCDLGSLDSVRACAAAFRAEYAKLDVLINNAGIVSLRREETTDGFEKMIGVNHLGHFLLTNLLLEPLQRAEQGRIVIVASGAYKAGRIHFEDPHLTRGFNVAKGYAQSKLANILFGLALAERLEGSRVTVNSLHPGAVSTSIGVNRDTGFGRGVHRLLKPFFLTPEQGAATAIHLATAAEVAAVSGAYFEKKQAIPLKGKAADRNAAERLWAWSEAEVGG